MTQRISRPAHMTFRCHACGEVENVEIIRDAFVGSAADFCSTCDEPREEQDFQGIFETTTEES